MAQKSELRKKRRQPFNYVARLLLDEHGTTQPCLISDISDSGARLMTKEAGDMPAKFLLLLSPTGGGVRRECTLVWREGKMMGVRFPDPPPKT
jgi:hypothetical protein